MKKKLLILLVCTTGMFSLANAQSTPAEKLAGKIADRLRDSLSLTEGQRSTLYTINLQLHEQKMNIRKANASQPATWAALMQRVENTRDSLYQNVITDQVVFGVYLAKKAQLIRGD